MANFGGCRIQVHSPKYYCRPESPSCYHWMWRDISASPDSEVSALYTTHMASTIGRTVIFQI